MALTAGTKLGPYEILSPLGAGGMGEVYRARDATLDRDVAIKVLPETFARDPERVARFQREAKVLASLNHPNIAAIHGFEESDGKRFLVLELVEGQTLAERLRDGAMPVDEALDVGKQMTEALEAAHERGIIHRDLKPANVKLTPEGVVKVLDFGLAKALVGGGDASHTEMANSPTITAQYSPTAAGVILGTAAYMSPEQARGKAIDKRTDIWSFGCVLYECLGGRRPFDGETTTDMLAKVLERDPDSDPLPPDTPHIIRGMMKRCLQKDRKDRLRDIGEAWVVLNGALTGELSGLALAPYEGSPSPAGRPVARAVSAILLLALAIMSVSLWRATRPVEKTPVHMNVEINSGATLATTIGAQFAFSPDGKMLAYVAGEGPEQKLYLRRLDQLESTALSGTSAALHPFFSPDGKWIAFFTSNRLKKVSVSGGTPLSLCETSDNRGGTWGTDGSIIFAPSTTKGLFRVQAAGGEPKQLTDPSANKERSHRWPQFLPGDKHVLFTSQLAAQDFNASSIEVLSLESMERTVLHHGGSYARYLPTGHIVYVREATIYCARLDTDRWELASTPAPVLEGVKFGARHGGAQFAFSNNGLMAYHAGTQDTADTSLVLVDRSGNATPLISELRNYSIPRFSPDGKRISVGIYRPDGSAADIWIYDLSRQTLSRLTFGDSVDDYPVWSPDGRDIAFHSTRDGVAGSLYMKRTDGSGEARRLQASEFSQWPYMFTPDGNTLIYGEWNNETSGDIWSLPLSQEKDQQSRAFLVTEFVEVNGALSPDGAWLAYNSNESGQMEIYIRPFPKASGKWQISTDGGRDAIWSPSGKELYYRSRGRTMMVSIEATKDSITAGQPEMLFELQTGGGPFRHPYDISPDGEQFVMIKQEGTSENIDRGHMRIVFNWFEELKAKVPTGRDR